MNTITNYTLFANGVLNHVQKKSEWVSFYGVESIILKNNNTNEPLRFINEKDKKLTRSLAEAGYKSNDSSGQRVVKRLRRFYKESQTNKSDWKHIVDATGGVLKVWITDLYYDTTKKKFYGDVVLFRESTKDKKIEFSKFITRIHERYRDVDGRYHDFTKRAGGHSFVHRLEMEREEMRTNTHVRRLNENASLQENTKHNNEIAIATNHILDELERLRAELKELKQA
ncbi:hypothetical protein MD535_23670 [Vibrio sp. ZSDZ65]|uniref:Uncharacterized protein n=1 Tax=Vibrio qingdaonensis TaxID=2829491 RepID=A0A9X3HYN9_9VIBR|nr:hypothetical protein [Vibrio qingdaonensis]MCW8348995.1 hypothetical protein [Vibrio qingdaonensis]